MPCVRECKSGGLGFSFCCRYTCYQICGLLVRLTLKGKRFEHNNFFSNFVNWVMGDWLCKFRSLS